MEQPVARTPRSRADVQLFTEIGAIGQLARNRIERALPAGLSQAQFDLLVHLASHGRTTNPVALAATFRLTKGAITNTLQRLAAQGCVLVEGDADDGRRKRVSLTPAGYAMLNAAVVATRPVMEQLRSRFSDAEFEAALPFLVALREWLEQRVD
jgi:DNA-binding MarR family transcriptional regulator